MTLPPVSVLGVGAVTAVGRTLPLITAAISDASPATAAPRTVSDDVLADPATSKRLRRADRFTRMAVIAASDAWSTAKASLEGVPLERIGLIVASGFGPHGRGFKFLDGILDHGDSAALPTDFSHSVHGAPAAYITEILGLRGPSLSTTDFLSGFEQAVLLAQAWLDQQQCDRVLVGVVEELGEVLLHCAGRMLNHDQRISPGEGAVFWMLGRSDTPGIATLAVAPPAAVDLRIVDQPVIGPASPTIDPGHAGATTTFSPYFGHSPSSAAFQLLGGLLSMQAGRLLGRLIGDESSAAARVDNVATFRPSFDPSAATLRLTKVNSEPGPST